MISGYEMSRLERYLVVFDGKKFDVIDDWDFRPGNDIPMTEISTDYKELYELKKAFEYAADFLDVVEVFRRDKIKDKLLAATINISP